MAKKTVVDCCEHCRYYDLGYSGNTESYYPICWNNFDGISPKRIDNIKSIPDWCELEDGD